MKTKDPTTPTIDNLRDSLQSALEVELFTLPPYLYALYSLHPVSNQSSAEIIRTIAMEEMLHIVLVANVLNAVGGAPSLCPEASSLTEHPGRPVEKKFYPAPIPHIESNLSVSLLKFSLEAIKQFEEIEKPEELSTHDNGVHKTIGAFYAAIRHDLITLCTLHGEDKIFCGETSKQIQADTFYYGGGGKVISVHDLHSALEALEQVAEQGEGMIDRTNKAGNAERFGQPHEPAHYYRFKQVEFERYYLEEDNIEHPPRGRPFNVDWQAVYPAQTDPKPSTPDEMTIAFEQAYGELLTRLHLGLNGNPTKLRDAASSMFNLRYAVETLMRKPDKKGTAGVRFWYLGPLS